ncbi:MAG: glycosyl hydrolase, partial [Citricoccus sp.]|nr:glycosyl hydrolase [Citricoccus sp. WCRC_4]
GLSYTSFDYDGLRVAPVDGNGGLDVSFTVTNTGGVTGAEAAQVYLTLPDEAGQPAKRLVGFEKVSLRPGERKQVSVRIGVADSNRPFSYFAPTEPEDLANWSDGAWTTADGRYRVHVGGSSADTPLEQGITLRFPAQAPGRGGA